MHNYFQFRCIFHRLVLLSSFAFMKNRYSRILFDFLNIESWICTKTEREMKKKCNKMLVKYFSKHARFRIRLKKLKLKNFSLLRDIETEKISSARYRSANNINHPCNNYREHVNGFHGRKILLEMCSSIVSRAKVTHVRIF